MPVHQRSVVAVTPLERKSTHDATDVEEEERFRQWIAASDRIVREHKDAAGWEEPPKSVLRRRRKRD